MLIFDELKELKELHDAVFHIECFSSRDVLREGRLLARASDKDLEELREFFGCDHFDMEG